MFLSWVVDGIKCLILIFVCLVRYEDKFCSVVLLFVSVILVILSLWVVCSYICVCLIF